MEEVPKTRAKLNYDSRSRGTSQFLKPPIKIDLAIKEFEINARTTTMTYSPMTYFA
jgi:hypothetical protein